MQLPSHPSILPLGFSCSMPWSSIHRSGDGLLNAQMNILLWCLQGHGTYVISTGEHGEARGPVQEVGSLKKKKKSGKGKQKGSSRRCVWWRTCEAHRLF